MLTDSQKNPLLSEKMNLVLMAATCGTVKEAEMSGQPFLVLHSFLEVLFEASFFFLSTESFLNNILAFLEFIKEKKPEQFRMFDHNGSLPLHIVMRVHSHSVWRYLIVLHTTAKLSPLFGNFFFLFSPNLHLWSMSKEGSRFMLHLNMEYLVSIRFWKRNRGH